ncbi:hypothetical protein H4Q32_005691 [Labeo rohita]|uniref:Uncharacterized protein n=1 Tax=Labeo rohita TaxID=84645 RepID=A0ABQ8LRC6_LABRO|nr:hypothetical protein H4Q32_005691 [Labeo rohita]
MEDAACRKVMLKGKAYIGKHWHSHTWRPLQQGAYHTSIVSPPAQCCSGQSKSKWIFLSLRTPEQTVALHPGLHSPPCSALIGSATVTNQRRYKSPVPSSLAWPSRLVCLAACLLDSSSFHGLFPRLSPLRITFATDQPTPASRTSIVPRPDMPVCCCFDPACFWTMSLPRRINKSLQINPLASHLSLSVTEYSVTTGSSSFTPRHSTGMDSDRILLRLRQGPRTLEQYIREFLAIANYSTLPDCIIIEIFCDGVNEPLKARLRREGPRSSLAAFLDFALLCVGSFFTVGVAEEECDISVMPAAQPARGMAAASERAHVMAATAVPVHKMAAAPVRVHTMAATAEPVHKVATTAVPVRKMAVALVRAHKMAATTEPVHKMAANTELRYVTAATPEPNQVAAAFQSDPLFLSQVRPWFLSQARSQPCFLSQARSQPWFLSQAGSPPWFLSQARSKLSFLSQAGLYEPSQVIADLHESSQVTIDLHEPSRVIADLHEPSQAIADLHEPSQAIADLHEPGQVTADLHEPSQVTADLHESSQFTTGLHKPGQATAGLHEPSQASAGLYGPESSHVPPDGPESSHVPPDGPESSHIPPDRPEPRHVSSDHPVPRHVSSVCPEQSHVSSDRPELHHVSSDIPRSRPIMMASVLDPPLVSVRAANIPVASTPSKSTIKEVLPPATALPLMAVAIWCVWAAHCAPEVTSVHKSAPEVTSVNKSAPEVTSVHKSALEVTSLNKSAPEITSVHKSALEVTSVNKSAPEVTFVHKSAPEVPPGLKSAPEVTSGLKSAPEVPSGLKSAPEVPSGLKSAPEVPSGLKSAPEAFPVRETAAMPPELSALAVEPPMEAVLSFGLSASLLILSASSIPTLPRSQSMTRVPALLWRAPEPPVPPWRASAPPAPPWRAPALPALPWRVPALPVLPQSPGPPHGTGPPALALSRSRPTAPLDYCSVGASGSRSLGGGYVMNLVGDLRSAHHQMSLSPCHNIQTVALHPGLHSPPFSALIGSAPVTNQRRYKSPVPSPGLLISSVSPPAYWTLARFTDYSLVSLRITFVTDRPTPASRTSIVPRPDIPVCCCFDPACFWTMSLPRRINKSLQMDPLASRLSLSVTTTFFFFCSVAIYILSAYHHLIDVDVFSSSKETRQMKREER